MIKSEWLFWYHYLRIFCDREHSSLSWFFLQLQAFYCVQLINLFSILPNGLKKRSRFVTSNNIFKLPLIELGRYFQQLLSCSYSYPCLAISQNNVVFIGQKYFVLYKYVSKQNAPLITIGLYMTPCSQTFSQNLAGVTI